MPFNKVASDFQPEQITKMTAAFARAWPHVCHRASSESELERLRERLANCILFYASQGEFDSDKLADQVIRDLTRRDRTAA
jgi:hypothetical protein